MQLESEQSEVSIDFITVYPSPFRDYVHHAAKQACAMLHKNISMQVLHTTVSVAESQSQQAAQPKEEEEV